MTYIVSFQNSKSSNVNTTPLTAIII